MLFLQCITYLRLDAVLHYIILVFPSVLFYLNAVLCQFPRQQLEWCIFFCRDGRIFAQIPWVTVFPDIWPGSNAGRCHCSPSWCRWNSTGRIHPEEVQFEEEGCSENVPHLPVNHSATLLGLSTALPNPAHSRAHCPLSKQHQPGSRTTRQCLQCPVQWRLFLSGRPVICVQFVSRADLHECMSCWLQGTGQWHSQFLLGLFLCSRPD